ncbi:uncharacterized protein LOC119329795 [Triticum dicoccoides]|uniref:uncharacterized protein LOC119329795 n=1 Tax=Triticum dicoccoides TaxID=85692 RepID=UPI0018911CCC|nr:uncharacterized protein LOC119329795 [Triticum dicoccoides]
MVPLLIPLLGSVAAKAGDAMVRELLRAWGLDKARRKLERHLAAVQCILLDAEDKSRTNPAIRQWIKDLKTAAYQADDVLDAFRYEVLRRRAAQIRSHSTARKVLSYFSVNSPIVFRLSMSGKMKDALKIIDELVTEMNTFHFLQNTEAPTVIHPRTNSHVDNSEIVGKEDEKELVVKILLEHSNINNNNDDNTIMVLPIVGMGGIDSDVWKNGILTTTGTVPALQLSYDHLSSEAKICFFFCAIFPKDSPMDKDLLIQLWMENDFIASETRGQQIFDLLVCRCFLQDVEIQKDLLSANEDEKIHRPTTCKMHDLADSISGNDCSILQESSSHQEILQGSTAARPLQHEAQHLSLHYVSNQAIATMEEILATRARTILVQSRGIDQLKDLNLGGALSLFELRKVHVAENAKEDAKAETILEALLPHKRLEILVLLADITGNGWLMSELDNFAVGSRCRNVWVVDGTKGIANTILVCHIATNILELRSAGSCQPPSDHKTAAIHLSRYCAYLVANSPELLPEDDEWCKSLYKTVKKKAEHILAGVSTAEVEYQQLVELMSASQNHEVLKDGAKLGQQLAELNQGETSTAWELLAGFWSEMMLYIAPSDNIDGHSEAIARGGELITLIWALLAHLGIFSRAAGDPASTTGESV